MKPFIKIVLIVISLLLTLFLGVVIYVNANQTLMSEEKAKQLVEKRYDGKVKNIQLRKNETEFDVHFISEYSEYRIIIDRKNESVKQMTKTKSIHKPKTKEQKDKEKRKVSGVKIGESEAKAIAKKHVGGTFVAMKRHQSKQTEYYAVTQHVNALEGANVMINRVTGKVTSVSWFTREAAIENGGQGQTATTTPSNTPSVVEPSNALAPPQNTLQTPYTHADDDNWDDDDSDDEDD
ncbi:PepSY domain-containing protein [Staphylococcus ratti]|uniref:PepSY domain-containing protein n=1 Tax=Staphylococcus ratti TaxID=2892440 RepID=A0ABY3PCM2_9STAP|nr:PepSY domain-containing protein [Staphylococcus ratti]UEX90071.1 PepSY domain-containing protein [Staphylococcus ratti]